MLEWILSQLATVEGLAAGTVLVMELVKLLPGAKGASGLMKQVAAIVVALVLGFGAPVALNAMGTISDIAVGNIFGTVILAGAAAQIAYDKVFQPLRKEAKNIIKNQGVSWGDDD